VLDTLSRGSTDRQTDRQSDRQTDRQGWTVITTTVTDVMSSSKLPECMSDWST